MDNDLDIPEFLRRDKRDKNAPVIDNATVSAVKPDANEEKWRVMEQQRREQRRTKAKARVAKMMAIKADREALAAGKTWNVIKGRWE